jgi:hypothetical protein
MTLNQIKLKLQNLLEAHPQIQEVKSYTPQEWINWANEPKLATALFQIVTGQLNAGREIVYSCQFWMLDKGGVDNEFSDEVDSDMLQVLNDIILTLRQDRTLIIDSNITWNLINEKFEDYLSGVTTTFNISTIGEYSSCDYIIP